MVTRPDFFVLLINNMPEVIITPDIHKLYQNHTMPVYRDYEITINLNELVEHTIPLCDVRHPDNCLTSEQIDEVAHDLRGALNFDPIFQQAREIIAEYVRKSGADLPVNNVNYSTDLHYK